MIPPRVSFNISLAFLTSPAIAYYHFKNIIYKEFFVALCPLWQVLSFKRYHFQDNVYRSGHW